MIIPIGQSTNNPIKDKVKSKKRIIKRSFHILNKLVGEDFCWHLFLIVSFKKQIYTIFYFFNKNLNYTIFMIGNFL